jgi:hypothetical protein
MRTAGKRASGLQFHSCLTSSPDPNGVALLPRLLLVGGLSVGVMVPLIWAAFAPVPEFRQASEPSDPVHSGPARADWRGVPTPEVTEPFDSSAQSNETTIGTAPDGEGQASATRSDDVLPARPVEPALAKRSFTDVYEQEAAPEPLLSREAKPLPGEAATPAVKVETLPEVKERRSAPRADNYRPRADASGIRSRQKSSRKQPRDRSGWIDIMRDAGWLEPLPRR